MKWLIVMLGILTGCIIAHLLKNLWRWFMVKMEILMSRNKIKNNFEDLDLSRIIAEENQAKARENSDDIQREIATRLSDSEN